MSGERATTKIDPEPVREAAIHCGAYFVVLLAAVAIYDVFPNWTALTGVLVLLPYLIILGFVLQRRRSGRPWFPVGDAANVLLRYAMIWAILAVIAFIFAYNNGLFRPLSPAGRLSRIGTILEEPLAEEFVFRGALLTLLNRTRLGVVRFWRTETSVFAGAAIFSFLHFLIFLTGGYSASDALISSGSALIASTVFGVIYLRTQNVWYGVFLHMLLNFAQWN